MTSLLRMCTGRQASSGPRLQLLLCMLQELLQAARLPCTAPVDGPQNAATGRSIWMRHVSMSKPPLQCMLHVQCCYAVHLLHCLYEPCMLAT